MRSSLSEVTLGMREVETFLHAAGIAKFDGVEFHNFERPNLIEECLKKEKAKIIRSLLGEYRLRAISINSLPDFSLLPRHKFKLIIRKFIRMVKFCEEIGCKIIVVNPSSLASEMKQKVIISKTAEALKEMADLYSENVDIGFEFLGFRDCSVNNLDMAIEVLKEAEHDRIGLVLDTFHYYISNSQPESIVQIPPEKLLLIHFNDVEALPKEQLKDEHRLLPGEGAIDLRSIVKCLKDIKYGGFLSIESFRGEHWEMDPFKLARHARESLVPFLNT